MKDILMKNIRPLLESAILSEDHLSMKDKPEGSQELTISSGEHEFTGWIAKQDDMMQIVLFKSDDGVDMYIEELVPEEEVKETVKAICKKLCSVKPDDCSDGECDETEASDEAADEDGDDDEEVKEWGNPNKTAHMQPDGKNTKPSKSGFSADGKPVKKDDEDETKKKKLPENFGTIRGKLDNILENNSLMNENVFDVLAKMCSILKSDTPVTEDDDGDSDDGDEELEESEPEEIMELAPGVGAKRVAYILARPDKALAMVKLVKWSVAYMRAYASHDRERVAELTASGEPLFTEVMDFCHEVIKAIPRDNDDDLDAMPHDYMDFIVILRSDVESHDSIEELNDYIRQGVQKVNTTFKQPSV